MPVSGTRNDIEDFEEQGFIDGVNGKGFVEFDEWQDAFRAAGYEDDEAARFIRKIREKVAAGFALAPVR